MGGPAFNITTDTVTAASVGVGVASPVVRVQVANPSAGDFVALASYGLYVGKAAADKVSAIVIGTPSYSIVLGSPASSNDLVLGWSDGSAFVERVRVQQGTGNVGIGTPSPGEKLEVSGNVKVSGKVTVGGATTEGLAIGNGRLYAFGDQGDPGRLDIANGILQLYGNATGNTNAGVYVRIASAAEGGQGAFRVRNLANTVDLLRLEAGGDLYVGPRKAVDSGGYCLYG